jgi:hypothetical protein
LDIWLIRRRADCDTHDTDKTPAKAAVRRSFSADLISNLIQGDRRAGCKLTLATTGYHCRHHRRPTRREPEPCRRAPLPESVSTRRTTMSEIKEGMEVIGADGVHVGTVDRLDGDRIKLTRRENTGAHGDHHHYIEKGFVADVEGDKVRLSANADVAVTLEEEESGKPVDL